ncbi:MAG: AAA family ATPase [Methylococcales bacterium]|nr:AAA family ATPase [Methylococcales bacterium]
MKKIAGSIEAVVLHAETLETEIKKFVDGLPYWEKYIADIILKGSTISDDIIEKAYNFLLEELKLKAVTTKPEITINYNLGNSGSYKHDLQFTKLENVEGVNALTENQVIDFCPNLTIIYGANGSGKSGYVRLLKNAFYSKAPEEIIKNIHLENSHKPINAKFTFHSNGTDIPLIYPSNSASVEFEQYAVFDGKSVALHLDRINELEFRPAGLGFFANFTEAIKKVEIKLNTDIANKQSGYTLDDLIGLFEGGSEFKTVIQNISDKTKIDDLKKYTPFSDEDRADKTKIEKQYDELLLASKGKEKEITTFEGIKKILGENRKHIEAINCYFESEYLSKITTAINDWVNKEAIAKAEGIENFKTDKILNIGTAEWKDFIISAGQFAKNQKEENIVYPENGDYCLLCHQPLSEDAQKLIRDYWTFIKSVAEENVRKAQKKLDNLKVAFEKLTFDLFPAENILTVWLGEKHPAILDHIKQKLAEQKALAEYIISDIQTKKVNTRNETKISFTDHDNIEAEIDALIQMLRENKQSIQLEKFLKEKTRLAHKEKFNTHFSKFEKYINNQVWIKNAKKANFGKRKITEKEKALCDKFFNKKYIDTFNQECVNLNGSFGIEINHTGSAGKSYRQLKLKGNNPYAILSEGEQKVIAIADFLSEMQLSEVNRGIIFDDPVTSLDETRKSEIAERLVKESLSKQVIIFTHDLILVSSLIGACEESKVSSDVHWIEKLENKPGTVWLKNSPSFEKLYKKSGKAQCYYDEATKLGPEQREDKIKNGFAALRTSYESLVVFDLFKGVVQRFNERVSVDSLSNVFFTTDIRDDLLNSFYQCCRYMEGHSHSDKYAYKKPTLENLNDEILRFNAIKNKIANLEKTNK